MLKKIHLFHQIQKFYNIFGEVIGENFITKLSDMTTDNVYSVLFDINEVLDDCDDEMTAWLNKLQHQIYDYCEPSYIDLNKILFHICNTKKRGFYELRKGTKPIYKLAQWLYKKGIV